MTVLEAAAEEPEEQAQGAEPDLERAERAGGAREARQQAELLSDDQVNQARTPCTLDLQFAVVVSDTYRLSLKSQWSTKGISALAVV
jgi:hypothetical protein